MLDWLHHFVFGVFPYIAIVTLLVGSVIRFDREQYTWRSGSSQILRKRQLMIGSVLFHVGVLLLFVGHTVGLLTPKEIYMAVGLTPALKQMIAIVAGGIFGAICFVGLTLLVHRRLFDPRIRGTSSAMDIFILLVLWTQLCLGLLTLPFSFEHRDGSVMLQLSHWAQGIVFFQAGAAEHIRDVGWAYKAHIVMGLFIFFVFPFSRLVHMWSAPVWYLGRPGWQIVRSRTAGSGVRRPVS
ncbi:MAG TPA: respiratory nitrate reductase subunit gamma [Alphaproteobacteria bacterium]|jgi:nitrate reductase gamma subunit|nr:respiratory nitrate reductase subunit gamma [Alphaproteobacteria bacterium]